MVGRRWRPRSIDCHGRTSRGDCKKKIGPDNPRYASGWCGQCQNQPIGPAARVEDDARQVRERLVSKADGWQDGHEGMRDITAGLWAAGYSPEDAVRHLLDRVLDGTFSWWGDTDADGSTAQSSPHLRQEVGYQLAAAVDAVAPLHDQQHHLLHGEVFDHLVDLNVQRDTDEVAHHEADDFTEGFMRYATVRQDAGHPPHPGLLPLFLIAADRTRYGRTDGAAGWSGTVDRLLEGFIRRWHTGDITVDTIPREHVCTITTQTMLNHHNPQQVDAVMRIAGAFNDAEIAAGRPSLFDPPAEDDVSRGDGYVGPVVWDGTFDDGVPPSGTHAKMFPRGWYPGRPNWPNWHLHTNRHGNQQSDDYDPTLDWGAPHSVGKWLTLTHPPQSMLDLGAWHPEHAATVATHPAASPEQRHIAEMTVRLGQREQSSAERCQMRSSSLLWQCHRYTSNPDGWCGECTQWMDAVKLPPDGADPYHSPSKWDLRWCHDNLADNKVQAVTSTMLAAYRRQRMGVAVLEACATGATDQPDGWTETLRNRGTFVDFNTPFASIFGGTPDSTGRSNALFSAKQPFWDPTSEEKRSKVFRFNNPRDGTGDPVEHRCRDLFASLDDSYTGDDPFVYDGVESNSTLLVDRHALRTRKGVMARSLMFSDYSAAPAEDWAAGWDDPRHTALLTEDYWQDSFRFKYQNLQVWGGEHGQPAVYSSVLFQKTATEHEALTELSEPPKRAVDAASVSRLIPHPWTLTERGLLDPVSGHVQVPQDGLALNRGGVAVFNTDDLYAAFQHSPEDGAMNYRVLLSGGDGSMLPQASMARLRWYNNPDVASNPEAHVEMGAPLPAPLAGASAPMCQVGAPGNLPQAGTVPQARTVIVTPNVLAAACQQAQRLGSDVLAVAWDDGHPLPGEDGTRIPTVHIDCDPHSERSRLGVTTYGQLLPADGLVWGHDDPQVVETYLSNGNDPLDLRFNPSAL